MLTLRPAGGYGYAMDATKRIVRTSSASVLLLSFGLLLKGLLLR